MKNAHELVLLLSVVIGTTAVDWQSLKAVDIDPKLPMTHRHNAPAGRITKGQPAGRNQFPYQVGLMLYITGGAAWCGGTLISNRHVITAAHCTDSLTTGVDVYLGAWDRTNRSEEGQQIIFVATKYVTVHEEWDLDNLTNDISVIMLPAPIEFNEYIQAAKLPVKQESYNLYAGEQAIASGWGKISDSATGATDILQYINVPIMTNSGCSPWYGGILTNNVICIKTTGGISTCNGDSGGPLVLADGSNTLIGATSFGIVFGCELGWPGVFTRITSYLDWIENNTGVVNNGYKGRFA
ncbi:brachyurin-like [Drosophila hydei]|uniref:Brachyurin-like n=1 Tax=Drosophila hydei TaxID=7224 RepID=A0A6J1LTI8_DROHY|nr:brachyurin-like [Drosophila hydei]